MRLEPDIENFINRISHFAGDYEEISINCAQGTLLALQQEFGLGGGEDVIKAATFMPGIASRKETCGAVIGGLMALGLKFGSNKIENPPSQKPEDKEEALRIKKKAKLFCENFSKVFGSTMCGVIRPLIMGRDYNSYDPEDHKKFLNDGGAKKCRLPPEMAARIAATIILEK